MKVVVKTRIRVNGREYRSVEEMPPNIRQAYENAMSRSPDDGDRSGIESADGPAVAGAGITFNGHPYASVDGMPSDVRALYESAMAAVRAGRNAASHGSTSGEDVSTADLPDSGPSAVEGLDVDPSLRQPFPAARGLLPRSRVSILLLLLAGLLALWALGRAFLFRT